MNHKQPPGAYRLFDYLMATHAIKNDAAIARKLDVAPPVISKLRNGTMPVGATMMLNVHETFAMPVAQIRSLIVAAS